MNKKKKGGEERKRKNKTPAAKQIHFCCCYNLFLLFLLCFSCLLCVFFFPCFKKNIQVWWLQKCAKQAEHSGGGRYSDWDWSECAAGGSKFIPISRGNFSNYSCPFLGNFSDNRHPFPRILPEKHTNFSKISGFVTLKILKEPQKFWETDPCLGILKWKMGPMSMSMGFLQKNSPFWQHIPECPPPPRTLLILKVSQKKKDSSQPTQLEKVVQPKNRADFSFLFSVFQFCFSDKSHKNW